MPEGHTIHRYARLHARALAGQRVGVSSPQAESGTTVVAARDAAEVARVLDGRVLEGVDAYGKHLFYRWEGERSLHVHLGLFGRFRTWKAPVPDPRGAVRVRLDGGAVAIDLAGATASRLISPAEEASLLNRLGPDPLREDANGDEAWLALGRRRIGVGAALLDQRVIAGIGNVYRAEILFAHGIHPALPANTITRPEWDSIWETTRAMLRAGERSGRIITVPASEANGAPSRLRGRERVQVYRREHCRRCETPVRRAEVANRWLYWCPNCQPQRRRRKPVPR
jgi:endonuclease-8